jgi:hypothetical protein
MAPHGEVDFYEDGSFELGMAIPAERHKHYFPDIKGKILYF